MIHQVPFETLILMAAPKGSTNASNRLSHGLQIDVFLSVWKGRWGSCIRPLQCTQAEHSFLERSDPLIECSECNIKMWRKAFRVGCSIHVHFANRVFPPAYINIRFVIIHHLCTDLPLNIQNWPSKQHLSYAALHRKQTLVAYNSAQNLFQWTLYFPMFSYL